MNAREISADIDVAMLPDDFSSFEADEVVKCIKQAFSLLDRSNYASNPSWLLNDWTSLEWETFAGKRTRMVDGLWIGTVKVKWNVLLPNGARLTDEKYARLLDFCRKACAIYRDGINGENAPALTTWSGFCTDLKRLCRWCVLHEKTFRPEIYGLSLIDQNSLQRLFNLLATGGWTDAYLIPERTVGAFYRGALGIDCPPEVHDNLGCLPENDRLEICQWIKEQHGYVTRDSSRGLVSRKFLASILKCNVKSGVLSSRKFAAIIRQFEPMYCHASGLLVASNSSGEHPSHGALTVAEACVTPMTPGPVRALCKVLRSLLQMHHSFQELLPDPSGINLKKAARSAIRRTTPTKHTPFIPIPIGLKYLGEALRWVDEYGDALVDFYLRVVQETHMDDVPYSKQKAGGCRRQARLIAKLGIPVELVGLGVGLNRIYPDTSKKKDFDALRSRPTLHQAIECLVGAVVISIGMLKPARSSELTNVSRDCLIGDGPYWLDTELAKSTAKEFREVTDGKPIPDITARAIQQVQRLGRGLAKIYDDQDEYATSRLFYLPTRTFGRKRVGHHAMLDRYLDQFCDYVGMPVDALGRRWYIRVHEMRKWFLLLLVWSGRFNVMDAARSIAGHTNQEHLQAYIERETPHESISEIESMYAADRLRQFEDEGCPVDCEEGLNELYEKVLDKFNVSGLEMIPARAWESYLHQLHEGGEFSIELVNINANDSIGEICVAFRSTRRTLNA